MMTGSSLFRASLTFALCVLGVLCVEPPAVSGGQQNSGSGAILFGTVFRNPGFSLPGAEVLVSPAPDPNASSAKKKIKKIKALTNARGEFVFHLPAGPMQYTVAVSAKGYVTQEKTVNIQGEERADVTFSLDKESK